MKKNNVIKSLSNKDLAAYICKQANNIFPDNNLLTEIEILKAIELAEERILYCFSGIHKKYFNEAGIISFNHLITDQYCMFLYMLANSYFKETQSSHLPTKLYYLNKVLHSVDIFYTTNLPDVFLLVHPIGTIIGRADFSDYFVAYQGCTVGCLNSGVFPVFNGKTILYANSSVLGQCTIGDNVCLAANSTIVNQDIPDNKIVLGLSPDLVLKENNKPFENRPPFKYGK